ncbi:MAG TPA: quinone oxidoreductase [bacterium]
MKAVRIHETGSPDVLRYEDVPAPEPGQGQALVRLHAAGVNFLDIYHRTGLTKMSLPMLLGNEGAGVVEAVGPGVSEVRPGDRVAYSNVLGSYAEYVAAPAWRLVPIPPDLDFIQAAAVMLQGMTAHYLVHTTYHLNPGEWTLVHAAAGGVGALLVQMAKRAGAQVIGTVSTDAKAEIAREAGADHIVNYAEIDFDEEAKRLTGGDGVHVVYDSVGRDTFTQSLNCLRLRGMLVLYGSSSGLVPPVNPIVLNQKGSLFLTRPSLHHYTHTREELLQRAWDVLGWVSSGELRLRIDRTYPLADAAEAHRRLEGRHALGKLVLLIDR